MTTTRENRPLQFPNLDFFPPPSCHTPRAFDLVYRGGLSDRAGSFVLLESMRLLANHSCQHPSLLLLGYFDGVSAETTIRERIRTLGLESSSKFADESTTNPWPRPYRRRESAFARWRPFANSC